MLAILLGGVLPQAMQAQTKKEKQEQKAAEVRQLVESQNYMFIPQTMLPTGGRSRQITPDFDLRVARDSILSYLPYFGRAYSAPINPTQPGGIQFKSNNFEYTVADGKKGGWDILIKPKDVNDIQQLQLNITESGFAYLQVLSTNRQPISFNGYVTERKKADSK